MANRNEEMFDKQCNDIIDDNMNMSVPWYLMAAYAYYVEDRPILSDSCFDRLAKKMHDKWDNIEHMHKHHISKDDLNAGTFLGEYPSRVQYVVQELRGNNAR